MNWLVFGILAATSFGVYNFFTKLSGEKFSPTVALLFLTATSFTVALIATLFLKFTGRPLVINKDQIYLPILAGVATGLAEIFYLFMFSKTAPLGVGTAVVIGGTMLVATVLGALFLKEQIDFLKIFGFIAIVLGIYLLSK